MFRNPLMDAVIVLVIVLLFVGPKKLPALGKGLGQGMREFKEGITGESKSDEELASINQATAMPVTGAQAGVAAAASPPPVAAPPPPAPESQVASSPAPADPQHHA
jgi:sec-independent protein translocase protein TatA